MSSAESADSGRPPVFELRRVGKRFGGARVLHDISLTIRQGERVALVGPNGAGKTTLLELLAGARLPSEGELLIFGHEAASLPPRKLRRLQRRIGTVRQGLDLVDSLRVIHNVNAGNLGRWSLARAVLSLFQPREVDYASRALSRVGVEEKLFERTERLSGGQQQRVALARMLVQDPDVVLADEPIASLDPDSSRRIMELLVSLSTEEGKTTVVCLHDVGYAFSHCARLIGLRDGRVVLDGPANEIPRSDVDALYRSGR
ncbi:MAG: ATP-binding cassette domain-containing protein [Gemmatimonadota bacterium]